MSRDREFPDFLMRVSGGKVNGASQFFVFGSNPDIDAGQTEVIWNGGGNYTFPATAATISFVSTSANDTALGTGGRTATVYGLNANYEVLEEVITFNGLTPVITTGLFLRVNRVIIDTAGSLETNEGTITFTHTGATTVCAVINPTEGQTLQSTYTVPKNHTVCLYRWAVSIQNHTTADAVFHFEIKPPNGAWNLKQTVSAATNGNSTFERTAHIPFYIAEKTDIRINIHDVNTNNTMASSAYDGILIDNTKFAWT